MKYCTKCDAEYEESMVRCPKDGGALTRVAAKTEPLPIGAFEGGVSSSATEDIADEIDDMLFGVCPSCDKVFEGRVDTCPDDGSRLVEHSMLTRGTLLRGSQTAAMDLRKYCASCNTRYPLDRDECAQCGGVLQVPTLSGKRLGHDTRATLDSVIAGKYRLLDEIGAGGFGSVFLAKHESLGKRFAVKLLRPQFSGQRGFRNRFHEEALKLSRLEDDNVVKVVDFGESGNCQYMVTEYVDGVDLGSIIYDEKAAPLRVAKIMRQVASALAEAHAKNIVHLDLKPANILVTQRRGRDLVRVIDFGIAEIYTEADASRQEAVLGTCSYMAPEQWRQKPLDPRTDIYSFGVICYEFLAGRRPFRESRVGDFEKAHCKKPPPPLRKLRPDVPAELEKLVHRCLEKDPRKRVESAALLESALDAYVRREENVLGRALGRMAAAILFLAVIAFAIWGVWEWNRDKTKPIVAELSVTGEGLVRAPDGTFETRSARIRLSVKATDDRRLSKIVVTAPAVDWEQVVTQSEGGAELPLREGLNTVTAHAVDEAGNESDETSLSIKRLADRKLRVIAPALAREADAAHYTNEPTVDLTLDEFSGVELRVLCRTNGEEPHFDLKVTKEGKRYSFEGRDAARQKSPAEGEKTRVRVRLRPGKNIVSWSWKDALTGERGNVQDGGSIWHLNEPLSVSATLAHQAGLLAHSGGWLSSRRDVEVTVVVDQPLRLDEDTETDYSQGDETDLHGTSHWDENQRSAGTKRITVNLLKKGANNITIASMTDRYGNVSEPIRLTVHYDPDAPELRGVTPAVNFFERDRPPEIHFRYTDANPLNLKTGAVRVLDSRGDPLNKELWSIEPQQDGAWAIKLAERAIETDGRHNFRIEAFDKLGNARRDATGDFAVVTDLGAPAVRIRSPAAGTSFKRGDTIHIEVDIQDAFPDLVEVSALIQANGGHMPFRLRRRPATDRWSATAQILDAPDTRPGGVVKPRRFKTLEPVFRITVLARDGSGKSSPPHEVALKFAWENGDQLAWTDGSHLVYHDQHRGREGIVPAFFMAVSEVSNGQFRRFLEATKRKPPPGWKIRDDTKGWSRLPARNLCFRDALAYAEWAGLKIPGTPEWLAAALWNYEKEHQRKFPWGDSVAGGARWPVCAETEAPGAADDAPGNYKAGQTPFGLKHMYGNVWEFARNAGGKAVRLGGAFDTPLRIIQSDSPSLKSYLHGADGSTFGENERLHDVGLRCMLRPTNQAKRTEK